MRETVTWRRPRPWLLPLVPLYLAVRAAHQAVLRADTPAGPPPRIPLVVVGALRVGGSGKTSVVLELARWAKQKELRTALLVYRLGPGPAGRRGSAPDPLEVHPDSDWRETSEEAVLLRRLAEVPVFATRHRARAWWSLAEGSAAGGPYDLLLSDDGFQDPRLTGAFRILLRAPGARPGLRDVLPAGPYRESWRAMARADLLLEGPYPDPLPAAPAVPAGPAAPSGSGVSAFFRRTLLPTDIDPRGPWNVLCALGDNRAFLAELRARGVVPRAVLALPDHAAFPERLLLAFARRHPAHGLLCTPKDALKVPPSLAERLGLRVVEQSLRLDPEVFERVASLVPGAPLLVH